MPGCSLVPVSMTQGKRLWHVAALQPVPKTGNHPAYTGLVPKFFVWKPKKLKISWDQPGVPGTCAAKRLRWKFLQKRLRFLTPMVVHGNQAFLGRGV